jgi:hypothetical protein
MIGQAGLHTFQQVASTDELDLGKMLQDAKIRRFALRCIYYPCIVVRGLAKMAPVALIVEQYFPLAVVFKISKIALTAISVGIYLLAETFGFYVELKIKEKLDRAERDCIHFEKILNKEKADLRPMSLKWYRPFEVPSFKIGKKNFENSRFVFLKEDLQTEFSNLKSDLESYCKYKLHPEVSEISAAQKEEIKKQIFNTTMQRMSIPLLRVVEHMYKDLNPTLIADDALNYKKQHPENEILFLERTEEDFLKCRSSTQFIKYNQKFITFSDFLKFMIEQKDNENFSGEFLDFIKEKLKLSEIRVSLSDSANEKIVVNLNTCP